jgi:hypothetical protein
MKVIFIFRWKNQNFLDIVGDRNSAFVGSNESDPPKLEMNSDDSFYSPALLISYQRPDHSGKIYLNKYGEMVVGFAPIYGDAKMTPRLFGWFYPETLTIRGVFVSETIDINGVWLLRVVPGLDVNTAAYDRNLQLCLLRADEVHEELLIWDPNDDFGLFGNSMRNQILIILGTEKKNLEDLSVSTHPVACELPVQGPTTWRWEGRYGSSKIFLLEFFIIIRKVY